MRFSTVLLLLACGCGDDVSILHPPLDMAANEPSDMASAADMATRDAAVRLDLTSRRVRRVFLTSTLFGADLGGLAGADAKCQAAADAVGLGGSWRAWLSDSFASPSIRFTQDGVFALVTGNPVADSWEQLTSGTLRHAIDVTESGGRSDDAGSAVNVWTDTNRDGTLFSLATDCGDWSDPLAAQSAVGLSTSQSVSWTQWTASFSCAISAALYCFEQ